MFYILHGDDTFTRNEELANLCSKLGDPAMADLNTSYLDGRTTTWDELLFHCDSIPLFSDRRLVIIRDMLARLEQRPRHEADARLLDELVEYLPHLPPTTRLVFVEQKPISPRNPVIALARASDEGYEHAYTMPRGNALTRWVQQRVRQEGGEIEQRAAQALCTFVGEDLYQLQQETQKLIAYTDGHRPITEADIQLLTPNARQASIFDLVDALGRRDGQTAIQIYHHLLDAGDHPLALLSMIARQFRLMIQVKELSPTLGTPQAIASALHQNPYPIKKILAQSSNYTIDQLGTIYHKLLDTDLAIKTGRSEPTLALDMLIAGLSRIG